MAFSESMPVMPAISVTTPGRTVRVSGSISEVQPLAPTSIWPMSPVPVMVAEVSSLISSTEAFISRSTKEFTASSSTVILVTDPVPVSPTIRWEPGALLVTSFMFPAMVNLPSGGSSKMTFLRPILLLRTSSCM